MKKTNAGFTLVEIMIVVLIIALLASIAIPNILRARVNANDSSAQASLRAIATAMETYLSTNNVYPTTTTALVAATPPEPPYLQIDYFSGELYNGFTFKADSLSPEGYSITAIQEPSLGTASYTITTGSVLVEN